VPPERVTALRRAFDATMKDPQFMAEADKAKMDISPMTGEDSQIIADQIANTSADVIAYAQEILGDLLR
jgi:tripartite-type tricarboxylate transporter receptor subunit TctC